ncbi:MAG: FliG C-terminal domain-containing protein [Pseudomonadota bacterium]
MSEAASAIDNEAQEEAALEPGISDPQAAAILMLLFSEDAAADVIAELEPDEVRHISDIMYSVANVGGEDINNVLDLFIERARHRTTVGYKADSHIEGVLKRAFGEQQAETMISRIAPVTAVDTLKPLKWMEPGDIAAMVREEPPQVAALVLSFVRTDNAAEVLGLLPEEKRDEIVYRLATLGEVSQDAIDMIEDLLTSFQSPGSGKPTATKSNDSSDIAAIMNGLDKKDSQRLLKALAKRDRILASAIEDEMFTFADLAVLDIKSIGTVVRSVDNSLLVPALKGADDTLRERILGSMSTRAAQSLNDEMEESGPLAMDEVKAAQKAIAAAAKKLADKGDILIDRGGGNYV